MRMNIMFGLKHVAHDQYQDEAARLLKSVSDQVLAGDDAMEVGDTYILRDVNGNRVGVADVFGG